MPPENPTIRVVAAVIERDGTYLVTQRRPTAVLPLLWEFPGGRVEVDAGEDDVAALKREVEFRLGVCVQPGSFISFVRHPYERYTIELYLYECAICGGEPRCVNVHDFRWVRSGDFENYAFTPADEASMSVLLGL